MTSKQCPNSSSLITGNGGNVISDGQAVQSHQEAGPTDNADCDDFEDVLLRWLGGTALVAGLAMLGGFLTRFF